MITAMSLHRKDPASVKKYVDTKRLTAKFKQTSKKAKSDFWQSFCSTLKRTTAPNRIWKTVKIMKNKAIPPLSPAKNTATWEMEFLDKIAPDITLIPDKLDWEALQGTRMAPRKAYLEIPFTRAELELQLASVNLKATPGPDNISYSMLYHLPEKGKENLIRLYNKFLVHGFCPSDWKNGWLRTQFSRPDNNQGWPPHIDQ
jgi:hypothetical protein